MGSWVRGGEPPDEVKVTFVVNSKKDPELAAWLWGLPYRSTSASVRDILSAAARRRVQQAQSLAPLPGEASTSPLSSTEAVVAQVLSPREHPHHESPTGDAHDGMTDAVADLMMEMDREF